MKRVGKGSFGEVYHAVCIMTQEEVAIKQEDLSKVEVELLLFDYNVIQRIYEHQQV